MPKRQLIVWTALSLLFFVSTGISHAQSSGKIWRIGAFHVGLDHVPPPLEPMRQELKRLGYEEDNNLQFDWRNLPDEEAARKAAKEFVKNKVDLIIAIENQTVRASK